MVDARALSQGEIDALLNQIPADDAGPEQDDVGGAEEFHRGLSVQERGFSRTIKTYDFRRPDKFSKEQWQAIQSMHELFARLVGVVFSQRLRTLVAVRLSSIDQGLYEEWQSQVPAQTVCCVFSLPPLAGNLVVEFNMDVASEMVDRLLGGTAVLIDRTRELGDIELLLVRSFSASVIGSVLEQMWETVIPAQAVLQDISIDPTHVQVAGPNDVAVTSFFEVNLGNHLGAMSICTPYTVVEPIAHKLSAQSWRAESGSQQNEATLLVLQELLNSAPLDVSAQLGEATVAAGAVAALQVGDTLVLDTRVGDSLSIMVGEHARFSGRPGLVGNRIGLTVSKTIERPAETPDLNRRTDFPGLAKPAAPVANPAEATAATATAAAAGITAAPPEPDNVTVLRPEEAGDAQPAQVVAS